ncbi:MAG: hypothetical protein AB8B64_25495 [Granulosicoccus sp.]
MSAKPIVRLGSEYKPSEAHSAVTPLPAEKHVDAGYEDCAEDSTQRSMQIHLDAQSDWMT